MSKDEAPLGICQVENLDKTALSGFMKMVILATARNTLLKHEGDSECKKALDRINEVMGVKDEADKI